MSALIIDHGLCNLDSIRRGVERCGHAATVSADPGDARRASKLILPGVGAFDDAMHRLTAAGWPEVLREETRAGIPLLGICLGMQLLADHGDEGAGVPGLGLIGGRVVRLKPDAPTTRVPHVGWNDVEPLRPHPLFTGIEAKDYYFVHSYHFLPASREDVVATTPYCGGFVSVVARGLVWGTQFHPEKSQRAGLRLLANFLEA